MFWVREAIHYPVQTLSKKLKAGEAKKHAHGTTHSSHYCAQVIKDQLSGIVNNIWCEIHSKKGAIGWNIWNQEQYSRIDNLLFVFFLHWLHWWLKGYSNFCLPDKGSRSLSLIEIPKTSRLHGAPHFPLAAMVTFSLWILSCVTVAFSGPEQVLKSPVISLSWGIKQFTSASNVSCMVSL